MLCAVGWLSLLVATGCRQDMHNQPKFLPQRGTSFYADGRSVRDQVGGTVARSQGVANSYLETGLIDGKEGDGMPMPVTPAVMERGQERYNIYCSPCHSRVGNGEGMIVQRGYYQAANFHTLRLRAAPLGHFVNVMANGYGAMPMYAAQLPAADRWAVAAYIRALQLSQNAKAADAGAGMVPQSLKQIAEHYGYPETLAARQWGIHAASAPAVAAAVAAPLTVSQPLVTPVPASVTGTAAARDAHASAASSAAKPAAKPTAPVADAAAGAQVYATNCAGCHQANRTGRPPMIPALIDVVGRTSEEHVREVITEGVPGGRPPMPAFGERLSAADVANVVAYLKSAR
jgi:mono/diheme cytochrome c family protein